MHVCKVIIQGSRLDFRLMNSYKISECSSTFVRYHLESYLNILIVLQNYIYTEIQTLIVHDAANCFCAA